MKFSKFVSNKEAADLFSQIFAARDKAHKLHLSSHSYAEHNALGKFYEELVELVDELVEVYQGKYGLVELNAAKSIHESAEQLLDQFGQLLSSSRKLFEKDDYLGNIMDEITALTYRTLYKVRFLK
jgi:hypothetical protein